MSISCLHKPVLLNEVVDEFRKIKSGNILDCTVGVGGHSSAILSSNANVSLICCDKDSTSLEIAKRRLESFASRVKFEKSLFSKFIKKYQKADVRGVLLDLGVSSFQLDSKDRGFNFLSSSLDMRMDVNSNGIRAYDVVNRYTKKALEDILLKYGEVKEYKKVASLLCDNRRKYVFKSALDVSSVLKKNIFSMSKNKSLAKVFQALRIEVNKEISELENALKFIDTLLVKECIVAIISFHSLEDRIVKRAFKRWNSGCICPKDALKCECGNNHSRGLIITKKPLTPSASEIKSNKRARSAKMRVFLKNAK